MILRGAILAAGLGTRLRPLTNSLPKPLVPVAGRPLIEYSLDHLASVGVRKIGINAYHKADRLAAGLRHRIEDIVFVPESTLQGTGGGIRGIVEEIGSSTLIVLNGDALFDFDLRPVLRKHREMGSLATLALRYVPPQANFGRVGVDGEGQLKKIAELSAPGADYQTLFYGAYTGVQIIEPELVRLIPDGECDILRTAYKSILSEGGPIFGHFVPPTSTWVDVGTPERYLEAHRMILEGAISPKHLPCIDNRARRISESAEISKHAEIFGPCVIMPGARIEDNAVIGPYSFIGQNSTISSGSCIEGSVVWSGVTVKGALRNDVAYENA